MILTPVRFNPRLAPREIVGNQGRGNQGLAFHKHEGMNSSACSWFFLASADRGQAELWEEYLDDSQKFRLDSQEPRLPFAARLEGAWATKGHRCLCICAEIVGRACRKRPQCQQHRGRQKEFRRGENLQAHRPLAASTRDGECHVCRPRHAAWVPLVFAGSAATPSSAICHSSRWCALACTCHFTHRFEMRLTCCNASFVSVP